MSTGIELHIDLYEQILRRTEIHVCRELVETYAWGKCRRQGNRIAADCDGRKAQGTQVKSGVQRVRNDDPLGRSCRFRIVVEEDAIGHSFLARNPTRCTDPFWADFRVWVEGNPYLEIAPFSCGGHAVEE